MNRARVGVGRLLAVGAAAVGALACGGSTERDVGRGWQASGEAASVSYFVDRFRAADADRIDLLFMIDNSISMVDK